MKKDVAFGLIPLYRAGDKVEFLLVHQVAGHWAFPKGHANTARAETPLATAQREFEEETGITQYRVDEETSFQEEYYPQKDGQIYHKTVTYFPAWVSNKQVKPQNSEIQDFAWLEYAPAREKITFPEAKRILKQAKKYVQQKLMSD